MRHACTMAGFLVIFSFTVGFAASADTASNAKATRQLDEALIELEASNAEWRQNDTEFRTIRMKKEISKNETEEFAGFVAELHRKMLESCNAYRNFGGNPDRLGFDCSLPKDTPASGQTLPQKPETVQSEQEKTASLDAELDKSLSDFDTSLQVKQDQIRGVVKNRSTGDYAPSRNVAESGGANPSRSAGAKSGSVESRAEGGGLPPPPAEPGAGPGVNKNLEKPVVDARVAGRTGNDDNLLARQLREAAEGEKDPILREKLWAEYRKFKASRQ